MSCRVTVKLNGAPPTPEVKAMPLHKKNADVGEKQTVYSDTILIEQEDAASFADNEEVKSEFINPVQTISDVKVGHPHGLGQCYRPQSYSLTQW